MDILDIFSWLPAKEMSLDEIEKITRSLYEEARETGAYKLELDIPIGAPGINIHWAGAKC